MIKRITQILKDPTLILFTAIAVVNLGNYLLNIVLGRLLGPAIFAEVSVIATGILILSFLGTGFQMTAAKITSENIEAKDMQVGFANWLMKVAMVVGSGLSILIVLFARSIQLFLHFQNAYAIYLIAFGIPIYFMMSVGRGVIQGKLEFRRLAINYAIEMIARLVITIGLLFVMISLTRFQLFSEVVSLGFLFSFICGFIHSRPGIKKSQVTISASQKRAVVSFMFVISAYEVTQILISHSDVMLIKHFFNNYEAGLYSGLALIGRIVFFATWSIVTLLFPIVIQKEKEGKPHGHLFNRAFLLVLLTGVVITGVCILFPDLIIMTMFGSEFLASSQLLWLYALSTTLFASSNVFAYYHMSLNRYLPVWLTGFFGILQIVIIYYFHNSLKEVILIQIILMSVMLLSMIIFHLIKRTHYEKDQTRNRLALSAQ